MSAAIVGGLIGGGLVVLGLLAAQYVAARRSRWRQMQACATQLNLAIGRVLLPMFVPEEQQTSEDPAWSESIRTVLQALIEMRMVSHGRGMKRAEIRYLAFALGLRLQAALGIFRSKARRLGDDDLIAITGPNHRLQALLFGGPDPSLPGNPDAVDAAVRHLIENGLSADEGWLGVSARRRARTRSRPRAR